MLVFFIYVFKGLKGLEIIKKKNYLVGEWNGIGFNTPLGRNGK